MAITTLYFTPTLRFWGFQVLLLMAASLSPPAQAIPTATPEVSQLFQFTYPTGIRSLFPLPNGCLLLSTSDSADVYYIDPEYLYPAAQKVLTLPGSATITGFAALGDGFYAAAGATTPSSGANSSASLLQIHVIKVETDGDVNATIDHSFSIPPHISGSIEGLVTLPQHPHTILGADGIRGCILRINTDSGGVSVAFEHSALKSSNGTVAGVKSLEIQHDYLYFTNSASRTYGRFPIDENGVNTSGAQILAHLSDGAGLPPYGAPSYDGFSFDSEGNVFVAVHPSSILKIAPNGKQSVFVGGGADSTLLEPTSAVVSNSGKSIYISTAGKDTGYPISGGQLMKVQL